jgi:predicted ester cyclase
MSSAVRAQENETLARRFRQEIWKPGNLAIADEICGSEAVIHVSDPLTPKLEKGPQGLKQIVTMYLTTFPDAECTIEDVVVEGDKVVARWIGRGTHRGQLGALTPTGRSVVVTGIEIHRIAGGKIQETWMNWDALGLLQQLGATLR